MLTETYRDHESMESAPRVESIPFDDPLRFVSRFVTKLYSLWVSATYPFSGKGSNFSIHYTCELKRLLAHRIQLGNSVTLGKDTWLNVVLPAQKRAHPVIILDDGCVIGRRSQISAKNCVHLERDVMIGPGALIQDHSHEYEDIAQAIKHQGVTDGGTVRIGEGCWIGHGAAVVCNKGDLVLGRNCVVGANSVVMKSFPAYSVLMGNPAKIVRQYNPEKAVWVP